MVEGESRGREAGFCLQGQVQFLCCLLLVVESHRTHRSDIVGDCETRTLLQQIVQWGIEIELRRLLLRDAIGAVKESLEGGVRLVVLPQRSQREGLIDGLNCVRADTFMIRVCVRRGCFLWSGGFLPVLFGLILISQGLVCLAEVIIGLRLAIDSSSEAGWMEYRGPL